MPESPRGAWIALAATIVLFGAVGLAKFDREFVNVLENGSPRMSSTGSRSGEDGYAVAATEIRGSSSGEIGDDIPTSEARQAEPTDPPPVEKGVIPEGWTSKDLLAMASMGAPEYRAPSPLEEIARSIRYRGVSGSVSPEVLGPPHVGFTLSPSPSLFWYVPERLEDEVELLVVADDAPEPLVRLVIDKPVREGIHELDLKSLDVSLEPDITYRWFVTIWSDGATRRLRSAGAIRRISPAGELESALDNLPRYERGHVLAANGIWYDAFELFFEAAQMHPHDSNLQHQYASLLNQVGISGFEFGQDGVEQER